MKDKLQAATIPAVIASVMGMSAGGGFSAYSSSQPDADVAVLRTRIAAIEMRLDKADPIVTATVLVGLRSDVQSIKTETRSDLQDIRDEIRELRRTPESD